MGFYSALFWTLSSGVGVLLNLQLNDVVVTILWYGELRASSKMYKSGVGSKDTLAENAVSNSNIYILLITYLIYFKNILN